MVDRLTEILYRWEGLLGLTVSSFAVSDAVPLLFPAGPCTQ